MNSKAKKILTALAIIAIIILGFAVVLGSTKQKTKDDEKEIIKREYIKDFTGNYTIDRIADGVYIITTVQYGDKYVDLIVITDNKKVVCAERWECED